MVSESILVRFVGLIVLPAIGPLTNLSHARDLRSSA